PYTSPNSEDTTTITLSCEEAGTYRIAMEGKELKTGTIAANIPLDFVWDGYYWDKQVGASLSFEEGSHILDVSIFDLAGNEGTTTETITIDSTNPIIQVWADPLFFSPATSTGSGDYCSVFFSSNESGRYEVSIDNETPSGEYSGDLFNYEGDYYNYYVWDGSYTTQPADEGTHSVEVMIWDTAGNYREKTIVVTIDNTPPLITSLTENTGGEVFYLNEVIQFTMKARDWMGTQEIDADDGLKAIANINGKDIKLTYLGEGLGTEGSIYQGYYTVSEQDYGTWTISGYFMDKAGNPATNYGTITGTISVNGTRERPVKRSRISRVSLLYPKEIRPSLSGLTIIGSTTDSLSIKWEGESLEEGQRIKVIEEERKHIWVGTFTNSLLSLNNGLLYYGEPISDYRNVKIGVAYALKKALKVNDELILSLEGCVLLDELIFSPPNVSSTSLTIQNSKINIGDYILVSDNVRTWMSTATDNGSFTISNSNLYSGPIISDYTELTNLVARRVAKATGGDATIDIGEIRPNIPLSDDGVDGVGILSGDITGGDGIYSGIYTIKEGDSTNDAQILGHFFYNKKRAENDPYIDERLKVTIDATPPEITNNNIFPTPFNPCLLYPKNLAVMFNLSEKSYIVITIKNSEGEVVRVLKSPKAEFGDNVTIFWDGRTSAGDIPPDDYYSYTIEAEDEAGNKAIPKMGEIVLTTIEIKVENLNISPNPFWPDKAKPETIDVVVSFRVILKNSRGGPVTDEQLDHLGFNFIQGWNWLKAPYALIDLQLYDENGERIELASYPDACDKTDSDPWLRPDILPNYGDYEYSLGDPAKPDKGDGDTTNDFNYFVPFYKDNEGNYYKNFSFGMKDWDDAEGQYIFRIGADLTSIYWKLTNKPEDSEENWHAIPYFFDHNGLKADYIEGKVLAQPSPSPPPCDDEKPLIIATQPAEQDVISQGTISEVWAKLIDMPTEGGSGIDFEKSEIFLVDSFDQKIGGKKINDGIDTIYWILDHPLDNSKPGSYTIKIRPVDREGNGVLNDYQRATFQIKDIMKPDVFNPSPTGVVISPFEDVIYCFISDVGLGNSGIDSQKTTMSLKKEKATFTLVQSYSPTGKNSGKLMGDLGFPLLDDGLWDGTYTVLVKAYDGAGNYNLYQWSFYLKTIVPKIYDAYPVGSILKPYQGTISAGISELEEDASGIDWQRSIITLKDPDNNLIPLNITFQYGTSSNIGFLIGSPILGSLTKEGLYTFVVYAYDKAEHCSIGTYTFELKEVITARIKFLSVSDNRFSPGTSTGSEDTIEISFLIMDKDGSWTLFADNATLTTGFLKKDELGSYIWAPGETAFEGSHTITLEVIDPHTQSRETQTISVYVDNTPPEVISIIDNTGERTFYRGEKVVFILEVRGTDTDVINTGCVLRDNIFVPFNKISETKWQGEYTVTEQDKGDFNVKGFVMDSAGNGGTSTNLFGTITLDGTKANPITVSRIARLGIIPERKEERALSGLTIIDSTTETLRVKWQDEMGLMEGQRIEITSGNYIWITTLKNQEALISNAELYYGLPISDYRSITPQAGYSLKSLLKGGDKLIISLASFKVEKTIRAISTKTTTNITITSPEIKQGRYILVSDSMHSWFLQAKENGICTISNQNLYSGPLVSSYNTISDLVVEEVNWATGGDASADLGVMYQGIQLVDNGMSSFFDKMPGDGIYSSVYEIKEGNSGTGVLIQGHFIYNNYNALNDPYIDERIKIDVDGTKPEIKNQNIEPNPFNPYIQNLSIKYNLSEKSRVQINILNEDGEVVKRIVSPNPKYGENISDFWDGRDNNGDIVPDGTYYYTIEARDMAGNEATKVKGEIKVISIEIKIENLTFSSNPFYSDDIPESCDVLVKFRAVLKSSKGGEVTDQQLNNLGFDFVQYSNHLNIPYGLLNFETHNDEGEKIPHTSYPDMTAGNDIARAL
ncbi:MAG: FlgD immunoglobulin-like domain containing protein, partial [bacterium]